MSKNIESAKLGLVELKKILSQDPSLVNHSLNMLLDNAQMHKSPILVETFKTLLEEFHADPNLKDKNGVSPIYKLLNSTHFSKQVVEVIKMLIEKGASVEEAILDYVMMDNNDALKVLQEVIKELSKPLVLPSTNPSLIDKVLSRTWTDIKDEEKKEALKVHLQDSLEKLVKHPAVQMILEMGFQNEQSIIVFGGTTTQCQGKYFPEFHTHNTRYISITCANEALKNLNDWFDPKDYKIIIPTTLIHELTHLVIDAKFHNNCNPFSTGHPNEEKYFIDLGEELLKSNSWRQEFNKLGLYEKNQYPSELIAYYFSALSKDVLKGHENLRTKFKDNSNKKIFNAITEVLNKVDPNKVKTVIDILPPKKYVDLPEDHFTPATILEISASLPDKPELGHLEDATTLLSGVAEDSLEYHS